MRGECTIAWDRPGSPGVLARQRYTYDEDGNLVQTWVAGDMNCDGQVNFGDVNAFVLAVSNPAGYQQQYPNCNILNGDINGDGLVDFGDVNPFVSLLSTGNAAVDQTFVWDAENRLVRVEPTTPINGDKKVEFKYDYLGRRVLKRVLVWDLRPPERLPGCHHRDARPAGRPGHRVEAG